MKNRLKKVRKQECKNLTKQRCKRCVACVRAALCPVVVLNKYECVLAMVVVSDWRN